MSLPTESEMDEAMEWLLDRIDRTGCDLLGLLHKAYEGQPERVEAGLAYGDTIKQQIVDGIDQGVRMAEVLGATIKLLVLVRRQLEAKAASERVGGK